MSAALIVALCLTVALLVVRADFLMGSVPLLILKHDTPLDARIPGAPRPIGPRRLPDRQAFQTGATMTDARTPSTPATPRHLWIVGVLALLWNAMGAVDYLMTQTRNPSYLQAFTADQLAYFNSFPKWAIATWAIGVWGGVAGALLLLLRRRLAVPVLMVSLASAALTFLYNFGLSDGLRIMGGSSALLMPGVVLLSGALLLLYARRMARNKVLRS